MEGSLKSPGCQLLEAETSLPPHETGSERSTESSGRLHPVGKRCPWPAQEPRWCRLLPTAWLSGFPSGLTSFSTPTSFCPQGVREATGKVVLQSRSPTGFPKSLPHTPQSQASLGESLQLLETPLPLGLFRPHLLSLSCSPGFTPPAITGLWVWDVVFAAGLGWSSMGRRLGYWLSEKAPNPHSH